MDAQTDPRTYIVAGSPPPRSEGPRPSHTHARHSDDSSAPSASSSAATSVSDISTPTDTLPDGADSVADSDAAHDDGHDLGRASESGSDAAVTDKEQQDKSLPRLPTTLRSITFAPLPITEARKRSGTLGVAARARMLRNHRERRARLAQGLEGGEHDREPDPNAVNLTHGLGDKKLLWPSTEIEDRSAEDPVVKLGKKILRGWRRQVLKREDPEEGARAEGPPALDTDNLLSPTDTEKKGILDSPTLVAPPPQMRDPRRSSVMAPESRGVRSAEVSVDVIAVCPWEAEAPPPETDSVPRTRKESSQTVNRLVKRIAASSPAEQAPGSPQAPRVR